MGLIPHNSSHITSDSSLTADTPFAQNIAANARAMSGRVEGEFAITVPVVGEMQMILRLEARGGKLTGISALTGRSRLRRNAVRHGAGRT